MVALWYFTQTEELELHTKYILTRESTAEETPFELWSHSKSSFKNFNAHSLSETIFNEAQTLPGFCPRRC